MGHPGHLFHLFSSFQTNILFFMLNHFRSIKTILLFKLDSLDAPNKLLFCQHTICRGAVIAQWFHLRLPSCHPRFKSQANHLRFYNLKWYLCCICHMKRTKIKNKRHGLAPHLKKYCRHEATNCGIFGLSLSISELRCTSIKLLKLFPSSVATAMAVVVITHESSSEWTRFESD